MLSQLFPFMYSYLKDIFFVFFCFVFLNKFSIIVNISGKQVSSNIIHPSIDISFDTVKYSLNFDFKDDE